MEQEVDCMDTRMGLLAQGVTQARKVPTNCAKASIQCWEATRHLSIDGRLLPLQMVELPVNKTARTQAGTIATEALLVMDTAVVTLEGPILMCTPGPQNTRLPTPQKFEMCAWAIVAASEQVSDAWKIRRWSAKAYRKYARSSCLKRASKTTIGETVVDQGTQRIKRLGPQRNTKALYKIIDTVFTFLSRCWI